MLQHIVTLLGTEDLLLDPPFSQGSSTSSCFNTAFIPLAMEVVPPVPPKDTPRKTKSQVNFSSSVATSVSKRKREDQLVDATTSEDELAGHSPKRHRMTPPHSPDISESTAAKRQSTLRRKKGVKNLSSLNLRHKAEQARLHEQYPRESKFQEGSLTDKPSQKPPSAFTRIISADSGPLEHVDALMTDYHNDMSSHEESTDDLPVGTDVFNFKTTNEPEQTSAFYRFGRRLASSFRPVAMWNKIWNETKEELLQNNIELERRKRQRLQAAHQYAIMKQTGQIPTKKSFANFGSISQRDSGVEMVEQNRLSVSESYPAPPRNGTTSRADSRLTEADGEKTLRGRMHFTRPSLSNLRLNMKRARSDVNLFGSSNRESPTSVSPLKADAGVTELRQSQSRVDLKKQHKLNKRVSDLEMKLYVARKELDDALNDASPMPKIGSKYERFTPLSTMRRKFVPGGLPSLPSERLLDAQSETQNGRTQQGDDQATIRGSRPTAYPRRAADLFEDEPRQDDFAQHNTTQLETAGTPNTKDEHLDQAAAQDSIAIPRATPDSKDDHEISNVMETPVSKQIRIKKRKSCPQTADGSGEDHETERTPVKVIKRSKSSIASHGTTQQRRIHSDTTVVAASDINDDQTDLFQTYADELAQDPAGLQRSASMRLSIDSTAHSLEPLYEEEEGVMTVPLNDIPSQPTAVATPARFGGSTRSMSPVKRSGVKAGAEEVVITRAAEAAKNQPARQARSRSPKKQEEYEWPEDVF